MRLLHDGPRTASSALAIAQVILRTNPRIDPIDALHLTLVTVRAARAQSLPPEFLAAALLQESAYDPDAVSSAGAVGIAQFEPDTAAAMNVDPFDPIDAIGGAAMLLGYYVQAYGAHPDAYWLALAAYNAGPGAVDAYHGIPPYPETRAYINDIFDRWAAIVGRERPAGGRLASGS